MQHSPVGSLRDADPLRVLDGLAFAFLSFLRHHTTTKLMTNSFNSQVRLCYLRPIQSDDSLSATIADGNFISAVLTRAVASGERELRIPVGLLTD
jgi:hypothetical protein